MSGGVRAHHRRRQATRRCALISVEFINLEATIEALSKIDSGMASELKSRIREIAQPTIAKAKGYARGLGSRPTGGYANSLSLRTRQTGVVFVSNDPGGGVIEFANPGAVILTGPRRGRRAGVPNGSAPPRALLKAILEDEETMIQKLNRAVQEFCDEAVIQVG